MTEELVKFETAKLAREKGFDEPTFYAFVDRPDDPRKAVGPTMGHDLFDQMHKQFKESFKNPKAMAELRWRIEHHMVINSERASNCYARPSQDLLERWLREKHGIQVIMGPFRGGIHDSVLYQAVVKAGPAYNGAFFETSKVATFELAREAALLHALKLLP